MRCAWDDPDVLGTDSPPPGGFTLFLMRPGGFPTQGNRPLAVLPYCYTAERLFGAALALEVSFGTIPMFSGIGLLKASVRPFDSGQFGRRCLEVELGSFSLDPRCPDASSPIYVAMFWHRLAFEFSFVSIPMFSGTRSSASGECTLA